jgi:hypothetical protein
MRAMNLPCAICGRPIHYDEPSDPWHPWSFVIDENNPVSRFREFGYDTPEQAAQDWNNLQPAHYVCNARKSAKTLNELRTAHPHGTSGKTTRKAFTNLPDGDW